MVVIRTEEELCNFIKEGYKPYFMKSVKRWYLRKGKDRPIVSKELEATMAFKTATETAAETQRVFRGKATSVPEKVSREDAIDRLMKTLGLQFSILIISTAFAFLEEKGLHDEYVQWLTERIVKTLKVA
jgi:hypothetical protein